MARPTRHPKTGTYLIRVAIPADLRDTAKQLFGVATELRENLRTKNAVVARQRAPNALLRLQRRLDQAKASRVAEQAAQRGERASLSDRQIAALAGIWYQRELAEYGDNPGDPEGWAMVLEGLSDQFEEVGPENPGPEDYEVELRLGQADRDDAAVLLTEHGFPPDREPVERVARAVPGEGALGTSAGAAGRR